MKKFVLFTLALLFVFSACSVENSVDRNDPDDVTVNGPGTIYWLPRGPVEGPPNGPIDLITIYITDTGKKYHLGHCSHLAKSKIEIDRSKAIAQGYTPCSRCDP